MAEGEPLIQIHGIVIDQTRWEVLIEGKPVTLSKSEFLLLRFLATHPGVAHSRQQIIDGTGGPDYPVTARSVDVQVHSTCNGELKPPVTDDFRQGAGIALSSRADGVGSIA